MEYFIGLLSDAHSSLCLASHWGAGVGGDWQGEDLNTGLESISVSHISGGSSYPILNTSLFHLRDEECEPQEA